MSFLRLTYEHIFSLILLARGSQKTQRGFVPPFVCRQSSRSSKNINNKNQYTGSSVVVALFAYREFSPSSCRYTSHCTSDPKPFQTAPKIITWSWVKEVTFHGLIQKIQSFLVCGAAVKFFLSVVDSLDACCHLLYTFQVVSSYYSDAVSEVAAAWSIDERFTLVDRSSAKSISWVTSNGCRGAISCAIFKNEVSAY